MAATPLADTTLVLADERQQQVIINYAVNHWYVPRGISVERGVKSAIDLNASPVGQDGRVLYWALVPRNDPHTLDILSATRTFKRNGKLLAKGQQSAEPVTSYCITSVITPSAHRKRGYGRHMLRLLHYCIAKPSALPPFPTATWGTPPDIHLNDATYSTLWSDVGRDFYRQAKIGEGDGARDGWVAVFDNELSWKLSADASVADGTPALDACKAKGWSVIESLPTPPRSVDEYEQKQLQGQLKNGYTHTILDSLASPGQLAFGALKASLTKPDVVSTSTDHYGLHKDDSWVYYTPTYPNPTSGVLSILHMNLADPSDLPDILDVLRETALRMNCQSVLAYEVPEELATVWKQRGATVKWRDDHIGAVAWYGDAPATAVKLVGGEGYIVA